jgi:DNA-binding LacI/PurR family transcriptional regulator
MAAPRGDAPPAPASEGPAPALEVVTAAASRTGAHMAALRVETASAGELMMSILVEHGQARVAIRVPDAAAAAWVSERLDRIRGAVEQAGLHLADLDLAKRGRGDRRRGRGWPR